jgi:putative aldouronate transport system substrate-binding protein
MEKKSGIHIQWIEMPEANYQEQKNLMLASNDLPDVFMSGLNDSDILRYGQSGTLIPQEKLIEQYAPLIKDLFSRRPDIKKYVTTPDNHIYILPRLQELSHRVNPDNMFINKTWLDKLGLRIPETTEEFYTVLKAFRERDPNGNGRRDELPLSFVGNATIIGNNTDFASMFAGFGVYENEERVRNHVMVKNGKVYFTANTPEFRNALIYFNRLYREGLIDPEAFTQDVKQYSAKGAAPEMLYGVFFDWFDENCAGTERARKDYVVLPPLLGADGKRHWNTNPYAVLARENFAITSKMKNPEVAIRWADLCYDWETSFELCYGPWGINLVKEGDKIIQLPPPAGMSPDEFRYQHTPGMATPFAVYEADHKNLNLAENHIRKFARLEIYRQYFPAPEEIYPKVFFLQAEEDELAIIRTDILDYVKQMRAKFIIGSESIDSAWNNYVQQLNQMGLPRYLELYQKALDRYNNS